MSGQRTTNGTPFSWQFVEDMARWSLGLAVAAAAAGYLVTRNPAFVAALALGAIVDVLSLEGLAKAGEQSIEKGRTGFGGAVALLAGLRLVLKAVVLTLAAFSQGILDLWGAAVGVLIVDFTLLTVGSIKAFVWIRQ